MRKLTNVHSYIEIRHMQYLDSNTSVLISMHASLFTQTRFLSNKASVYLKKKRLCLFHANKTELNDT